MTLREPPFPTPSSSLDPDECTCTGHIGCCPQHKSTRAPFPHTRSAAPASSEEGQQIGRPFRSLRAFFRSFRSFQAPKTKLENEKSVQPTTTTTTTVSSPYSESASETFAPATNTGRDGVQQADYPSSPPPPYQPLPSPTQSLAFRSANTLAPIHQHVPYHLSLDHIDCVRHQRKLGPQSRPILIPELSAEGRLHHTHFVYIYWSSEVYFDAGTFLQKEHFVYLMNPWTNRPVYLAGCPHQSVSISWLVFGVPGAPPPLVPRYVQAQIATRPHCPLNAHQAWNSEQGCWKHVSACTVCHVDAVCQIELKTDGSLRGQYTCYRDLGRGVKAAPNQPKWRPLLTGNNDANTRQEGGSTAGSARQWAGYPDVFVRVWHTAKAVGCFGLDDFVHLTRYGVFQVSKETVENREIEY
jgi:hypothetical protein